MAENNLKQYTFWLFAITAVVILAGIGLRDPWPPDEPRFALMAKEMWETGNWFFPHRGGQIYPDKPPMVMWMMMFFYALIGNLKIAFLLPSAILSMLTLWMTYDISKRLWDQKIALYAGLLLACTMQFMLQAKSGQLDAPVAFWVMLGCYGMLRHLILGPQWGWYYLSWFAMGMGVITKGVGFLPALFLISLIFYPPAWQDKKNKNWLKWLSGPLFLLLAIALWLVPMLIQVEMTPTAENLAYRDNILLKQTVNRYAKSWAHIKPFWYYIGVAIPLFWIPLSLFIPWLIRPFKSAFKAKDRRVMYPLIWVALSVFFFSLSKGKRAEYMLPMIPMFVLAIAPYFDNLRSSVGVKRLLLTLVVALSLILAVVGVAGVLHVEKVVKLTVKYSVDPWNWMATIGVIGILISIAFRKSMIKMFASFMLVLWLSYSLWMAPIADKAMSTKPVMDAIAEVIPKDVELGIVGFREKFLLHSYWTATHFGRNTAIKKQQQASVNWGLEQSNRYLLVNYQFIDECFKNSEDIKFDSFHNKKWLLFNAQELNQKYCINDSKSYSSFTKKVN